MATRKLSELLALLGPGDPKVAATLFDATDPDVYGKQGAQIASGKVLVDARRMIPQAQDRWTRATTEQKKLLRGVSAASLAVYVEEWRKLEDLTARQASEVNADKGSRVEGTESVAEAHRALLEVRDTGVAALTNLAGRDETKRRAIDAAVGASTTEEEFAQSVDRVAELVVGWSQDPALAPAAAALQVDQDLADDLRAAAARLRAAAEEETRRATTLVSQGDLDHQDGLVLESLRQLVRAFDAANARDRKIRRLNPITTARFFGRRPEEAEDEDASELEALPPEPGAPTGA